MGLLVLQVWHRRVLQEGGLLASPAWRAKFLQVQRHGYNVSMMWMLEEMILPLLVPLVIAVMFPYLICQGLGLLGLPPEMMRLLNKYAYPVNLLGILMSFLLPWMQRCKARLHDSIRDDRYLVGQHLSNFHRSSKDPDECGADGGEQVAETVAEGESSEDGKYKGD